MSPTQQQEGTMEEDETGENEKTNDWRYRELLFVHKLLVNDENKKLY